MPSHHFNKILTPFYLWSSRSSYALNKWENRLHFTSSFYENVTSVTFFLRAKFHLHTCLTYVGVGMQKQRSRDWGRAIGTEAPLKRQFHPLSDDTGLLCLLWFGKHDFLVYDNHSLHMNINSTLPSWNKSYDIQVLFIVLDNYRNS